MLPQRTGIVPSRNALRILRQLAFAGSTLGGICTVTKITYDTHHRVTIAEKIVKNKRTIQTSTPYYNATSAAKKLALMVDAAEAGEYDGLASLKQAGWNRESHVDEHSPVSDPLPNPGDINGEGIVIRKESIQAREYRKYPSPFTERDLKVAANDLERAAITHSWLTDRSEAIDFSAHDQAIQPSVQNQKEIEDGNTQPESEDIRTVRDLFARGRIIEAAEFFLETRSQTKWKLSPRERGLAVNIFYANCSEDNIWIARDMFQYIERKSIISPRMWKSLVIALTKANAIESASQLILKYSDKIQIPVYMAELVIRCLLETFRFREAAIVMYRNIVHDEDFSLCGVFLSNLWKKSRSIDLVNREFERIMTIVGRLHRQPTPKLFNPVLKAYVSFGRMADAETLVNDMITVYNVAPNCRTQGLLLLGQAYACNWTEVIDGLQEMHELGMTSDDRSFIKAFTALFLEFWPTHNIAEIRKFFMGAVEQFSLKPDQVLYEHVLQAYIQKGNPSHITELARLAEKCSWEVEMKEEQLVEHLQTHRRRIENSPVGFWQLLNAARVGHGQSAASQRILGYDQRSVPWPEVNCAPHSPDEWPNWYRRAVKGILTDRPIDQYAALDRQLAESLHAGDFDSTLWFYGNALTAGYVFLSHHVELVAIASLVEKGLSPTQRLVQKHWNDIMRKRVVTPQFFLAIRKGAALSETELIKLAVFRFYRLCWQMPNLKLKHRFMNHIATRYIERGQPDAALDLMITAYKSRWGILMKFNGACMSTMMRAFVLTGNLKGIRWCLLTALSRPSACTKDFLVEARRALVTAHVKKIGWEGRKLDRGLFLAHLGKLVRILEKKSAGDPELVSMLVNDKKRKRMSKVFYCPQIHKWRDDKVRTLQKQIAYWDEERELEWMTTPAKNIFQPEEKVWELWNQERVWYGEKKSRD